MGVDTTNMTDEEAAVAAVDAVKQLSIDLGIPQTLKEIGIPEEALEQLANDAFNDVCTGGNPREITEADILELYKKAY
jgi:lactaldehyde reductase